jgi:serine protease DegS
LAAALVLVFFMQNRGLDPAPVVEIQAQAHSAVEGFQGSISYAAAVENAAPAVVNIYRCKTVAHGLPNARRFERFFGDRLDGLQGRTLPSLGSGMISSAQGYILNSNHVIADATKIEV